MIEEMEWLIESIHLIIITKFRFSNSQAFYSSPAYNIFLQIPIINIITLSKMLTNGKDEKRKKHENEISLAPEKH